MRKKRYQYKVYNFEGDFLGHLNPLKVVSEPSFTSSMNGGFGSMTVEYVVDPNSFDEGNLINDMNVVMIYAIDETYPLGRLIYGGFISSYSPYVQKTQMGVSINLLGMVSLLGFEYYKDNSLLIHPCTRYDDPTYGTWTGVTWDETNVRTDTTDYKRGGGSVAFDVDVDADVVNSAGIAINISAMDISAYSDGSFIFPVSIPSVTNFSSLNVSVSSGGPGNYITIPATSDISGNPFVNGCNLTRFNIADGVSGGGSLDLANVIYFSYVVNYTAAYLDQTGFKINDFRLYKTVAKDDPKTVSWSDAEPSYIFKSILDVANATFPGEWFKYNEGLIEDVGEKMTYTFEDKKFIDALKAVYDYTKRFWWWHVGADGQASLRARPQVVTHRFVIGRDIEKFEVNKTNEQVINRLEYRYASPGSAYYDDATSQEKYGVRAEVYNNTATTDSDTIDQYGEKRMHDNKEKTINGKLVINSNYDLESIKVGDLCKIIGLPKTANLFKDQGLMVHDCDAYDSSLYGQWTAGGDTTAVRTNTTNFTEGNGSVEFDIVKSGSSAGLDVNSLTPLDLSSYISSGVFKFDLLIPNITGVTSILVYIGSGGGNYWYWYATTDEDGAAFVSNDFFTLALPVTTNPPVGTVDATNICYLGFRLQYGAGFVSQNGCIIDNFRIVADDISQIAKLQYKPNQCTIYLERDISLGLELAKLVNKINESNA